MTSLFENEREGQDAFFSRMGILKDVEFSHYNDGVVKGMHFEFKKCIDDKVGTLSQAVNYLSLLRLNGVPVPGTIALVDIGDSISGGTIYLYKSFRYRKYINRLPEKASSIARFITDDDELEPDETLRFSWDNFEFFERFYDEKVIPSRYFKVTIDKNNIAGWGRLYYQKLNPNSQNKKDFIGPEGEIKCPVMLRDYIEPYNGDISDFKEISDTLNPKVLQKQIGAFFTPRPYCRKSVEMVKKAVERLMSTGKFDNYVIIDRCAGTGNLERYLPEDMLGHVILNTIEPEEWRLLHKDFKGLALDIFPREISFSNAILDEGNALEEDFIFNEDILKYVNDPKCAVIIYENVPYLDGTSNSEHSNGTKKEKTFVSKKLGGRCSNDTANQFIWSGIEYYHPDAMILYSPIKYWSLYNLTDGYFVDTEDAFILNRKYFHATESGISLLSWYKDNMGLPSIANPNGKITFVPADIIDFNIKDISDGDLKLLTDSKITIVQRTKGKDTVNQGWSKCSPINEREFEWHSELNGYQVHYTNKKVRPPKKSKTSDNMLGYMGTAANTFNAQNIALLPLRQYNGNGQYVYRENIIDNLPYFAAACFERELNLPWYEKGVYSRGKGLCEEFRKDEQFLSDVFVWSMLTNAARGRSIDGVVQNEFSFDEGTWASEQYEDFRKLGLIDEKTDKELVIFFREMILKWVKENAIESSEIYSKYDGREHDGISPAPVYNSNLKYNLYQIDEEINQTYATYTRRGDVVRRPYYPELSDRISRLRRRLSSFYEENIKPKLIKYELVK